MIQAQGFWAWAANLVSSSTWKPDPGLTLGLAQAGLAEVVRLEIGVCCVIK